LDETMPSRSDFLKSLQSFMNLARMKDVPAVPWCYTNQNQNSTPKTTVFHNDDKQPTKERLCILIISHDILIEVFTCFSKHAMINDIYTILEYHNYFGELIETPFIPTIINENNEIIDDVTNNNITTQYYATYRFQLSQDCIDTRAEISQQRIEKRNDLEYKIDKQKRNNERQYKKLLKLLKKSGVYDELLNKSKNVD
jgi:hypothetical protein